MTKAATFGERSEFIQIGTLSDEAAIEALALPASELGVTYEAGALDLLVDSAQGYPFFLQVLGFATWRAARPMGAGVITRDQAATGLSEAEGEIQSMYTARIAAATAAELEVMLTLAELGGDGAVKRGELANALGKTTQQLSDVRARLLDKAIVTEERFGFLQFTLPGFAAFLLESAA